MIDEKIQTLEEILGRPFSLLIVDDTEVNRKAAYDALKDLGMEKYATVLKSEAEAKEFLRDNRPSYVITDLEMEDKVSGLYVSEEAFKKCVYTLIATGINFDETSPTYDAHHGPITYVIPKDAGIKLKGKKDDKEIWKKLLLESLDYFTKNERKGRLAGRRKLEFLEQLYTLVEQKSKEENWSEQKKEETILDFTVGTFGIGYYDHLKDVAPLSSLREDSYYRKYFTEIYKSAGKEIR